jgi:hypothetical protein
MEQHTGAKNQTKLSGRMTTCASAGWPDPSTTMLPVRAMTAS